MFKKLQILQEKCLKCQCPNLKRIFAVRKRKLHFNSILFPGYDTTKSTVMNRIVSVFYIVIDNNERQLISQMSQTKHVSKYLWTTKICSSKNLADIKNLVGNFLEIQVPKLQAPCPTCGHLATQCTFSTPWWDGGVCTFIRCARPANFPGPCHTYCLFGIVFF